MGLCKFCNNWITQPEGRRKKEFCNSTCRSNYWYGKNKKGKEIEVTPPPKVYNAPKLADNFIEDEPLSFDRLRQQMPQQPIFLDPASIQKLMYNYWEGKRECQCPEDYHEWLAKLEGDNRLNRKQKDLIKTTNQ